MRESWGGAAVKVATMAAAGGGAAPPVGFRGRFVYGGGSADPPISFIPPESDNTAGILLAVLLSVGAVALGLVGVLFFLRRQNRRNLRSVYQEKEALQREKECLSAQLKPVS